MAAALTVGELRGLARLHRDGVEGAREQLQLVIDERASELPALLGFPEQNLSRLREHDDPVELLVATIEGVPRVLRAMRRQHQRARAAEVAAELGRSARRWEDGTVELDPNTVLELVSLAGPADIHLGDRGGLSAACLRALLRECRRVDGCAITVTEHTLDVTYTTPRSRGLVRLHLSHVLHADSIVVPLPAPTVQADQPEHVDEPVREHVRPPPRRQRFAAHLVDALLAAAVGGLP